jgi:cell division protein FtsW
MRRFARSIHSVTTPKQKHVDLGLLFVVSILVIFGLVMVYDSSVVQAFKDWNNKYYYIRQQLIWVLLGGGALFFFSKFNFQHLKKIALPFLILAFLMLIAVFIPEFGVNAGGAHRWLKIGPVTVQPAEIIKLASIIFFAALFEKKIKNGPFLLVVGAVSLIVGVLQKDLGSVVVYFLTALTMYIFAGARLKYLAGLLPFAVLAGVAFVLSSTYRKQRVLAFLDPFSDPQGYTYHISQVLIALGSGGFFGLGIGQSRQKFEYIPEVTTDSIFAIVGEELGFIGSAFLIGMFILLLYKCSKIVEETHDGFGKLLAFGLTSWIATQTIINLAAMVSLIPLTGVPLPFISYGGSALLVNLVAIGILLNISRSKNLT